MANEEYPSVLGQPVELTDERRAHILKRHPAVGPFLERIRDVLALPEEVRRSNYDLMVVVKIDGRRFILTVYVTGRLVGGQPYEGKHPVLI